MIPEVSESKAKARLSRLLSQVEVGETIAITRNGKRLAELASFKPKKFGLACAKEP